MTTPSVRRFLTTLLCVLITLSGVHANTEVFTPPVAEDGLVEVKIGIFVVDISNIDTADQSFSANIAFRMTWHDPRLQHDDARPRSIDTSEIWTPLPHIVNRKKLFSSKSDRATVYQDGTVTAMKTFWGGYAQPLDLHDFPFDQQTFEIMLVADDSSSVVKLVPDTEQAHGIASELSLADWMVDGWELTASEYAPIAGAPELNIPAVSMKITATRESNYYLLKVILPLVLIVAASWLVFWISPTQTSTQISLSMTTMLTLIAYRFAVGNQVPAVPYMTRMDYFILLSTILVFLALIEVQISSTLTNKEHSKGALLLNRICRFLFPAAFITLTAMSFGMI